ncbi:formate--tetrahydrofolate ligase [Porphyromonas cangingivalis]|uniref:Formate--tetrahydrofolate ligase n=1 Tax=Porphyromonas cangingivalis TaxID=36874 RepID=A0A1T4LJN0_PORCN|nr:formate--tetrahydrofolate ligase [Porphyromonas cangingivalis]SJZ54940.1 Formate-tetrahydrofolate ligase [Porphyromonas cangingivalis]VEJ02999.1 Formate--tetrahydrofolate ligase [Porphyromonas cangingivalis]
MKSDIQIARETQLKDIREVAESINIPADAVKLYGNHMAKIDVNLLKEKGKEGKLILVSAITPTKAGIGKTTVSIGLALGLNKIGKKAIVALREPSLGPCFGMKGGAAGGGYAQVLPMEKINLHFTGDFHAITSANNMIAALLDNYAYQNRNNENGLSRIVWKRVLDVNDRSLRNILTGLGGISNGIPTEAGFDITPASEIMAILCLATDMDDLRRRIDNILLGYKKDGTPFTVKDLGVGGAITVLLMDAIDPNLVQTTEGTPAFIHGGPFANIAHGCNSVIATKMAMKFGEYTVTEAGFGADLGGEKFFDIKCRQAGLQPALTVLVATAQALKMHGGKDQTELKEPDPSAIRRGFSNMDKHVSNLRKFGQSVVICINRFPTDTDEEIDTIRQHCEDMDLPFAINNAFAEGGEGAVDLANIVVDTIKNKPSCPLAYLYETKENIKSKVTSITREIYGASAVEFESSAMKKLKQLEELGYDKYPVCIAKTQYSFTSDPKKVGAPSGFILKVHDIVVNTGAEMIIVIMGDIMRMPGLPKVPSAEHIDIVNGNIEGLS